MRRKNRLQLTLTGLVVALVLFSGSLFGQYGISNARSVAMGGAYTAIARGVEAPGWNPANLALSGKRTFRLNLISVGLGISNNSFSKEQYDLYNGKYLTAEDKQDILASIPVEGLRGSVRTEVQPMGISFGSFALTAHGLAASDFSLSKDVAELILTGNELGRVYTVGASDGEAWGISSFGVSTAFDFPFPLFQEFTVGGTFKYLKGFGYAKVIEATTNFVTGINGANGNGRLVIDHALGGSGMAFDLGAAGHLDQNWTFGVSLTNVANSINWDKDTERFTYQFTADSISVLNIEESDFDSLFVDSDETIAIEPFSTTLPRELRFGLARVTSGLTLAFDLRHGLQKAAGVSTKPQFSMGAELRFLPLLPLRGGASFGGKRGFSPSAGFGLDLSLLTLDAAVASQGGKGLRLAFGMMFRL